MRFLKLSKLVELELETAGLSCRLVFGNNSVSSSLIELLASVLECFLSGSLVSVCDSSVELLYSRLENGLLDLVAHSLGLYNLNALFSRFNVRHFRTSFGFDGNLHFGIISQLNDKIKGFCKKSLKNIFYFEM